MIILTNDVPAVLEILLLLKGMGLDPAVYSVLGKVPDLKTEKATVLFSANQAGNTMSITYPLQDSTEIKSTLRIPSSVTSAEVIRNLRRNWFGTVLISISVVSCDLLPRKS